MASASPSPQPEHSHWQLVPGILGVLSAAIGLLGRRKPEAPSPAPDLDRLSRLEQRFDRLEMRIDQQHGETAEIHRQIFELLQSREQESQS